MKTAALHCYVSPRTISHFRLLAVVAFIAICSDAGLAQDTVSKSLPPQTDTTATRQRRTSSESEDAVIVFGKAPLKAGRRVFVRSTSLLVRRAVVEDKLLKRPEFQQLGFVITRELSEADLILELRHDLFTMYVFTVVLKLNWCSRVESSVHWGARWQIR